MFIGSSKVNNATRPQFYCACLVYPSSKFSWWIVGVICGASALFVFGIVAGAIVYTRRKKRSLRSTVSDADDAVDNLDAPVYGQVKKIHLGAHRKQRNRLSDLKSDTNSSRNTDNPLLKYDYAIETILSKRNSQDVYLHDYDRSLPASRPTLRSIVSTRNFVVNRRNQQREIPMDVLEDGDSLRRVSDERGAKSYDEVIRAGYKGS